MADMALYARHDGLLEPRSTKAVEFVKANAEKMLIADVQANIRSSLQNRYLNGWVYTKQIIRKLNESGQLMPTGQPWTRDTIHAAFQECFLVKEEFLMKGRHHKVYESTATMSRKRFSEYIDDQIKPFVWDMWGLSIDDPNEGYWLEVMREMQR